MGAVSVAELSLAAAILAVGGAAQGSIGFGSMVVAAPLLVLIDPAFIPAPGQIAATVLVVLIMWRDRAGIDRRGVGWTLSGRLPGTILGGAAVAGLSATSLEAMFGVLLLLGVLLSAGNYRVRRSRPVLLGVGALSGLMGTATSVGGPPLALVYQHESGPLVRGTLSFIFLVGSFVSLATLVAFGELNADDLRIGLAISPGMIVGFLVSSRLAPVLDTRSLRPAILALAGVAAVAVLVKAAL